MRPEAKGDGGELQRGTDRNKVDTDGKTFADNVDLALNTDPTISANKPNVIIGGEVILLPLLATLHLCAKPGLFASENSSPITS